MQGSAYQLSKLVLLEPKRTLKRCRKNIKVTVNFQLLTFSSPTKIGSSSKKSNLRCPGRVLRKSPHCRIENDQKAVIPIPLFQHSRTLPTHCRILKYPHGGMARSSGSTNRKSTTKTTKLPTISN